jgi:ribosomal protein S18 acetylase RimI-like enzyme
MTADYNKTLSAYEAAYPGSPFFQTWVPREKFLHAEFDNLGNFAISRADDGIYGIALGESPQVPLAWKNFSIESRGIAALPDDFKAVVEWDSYWASTFKGQEVAAATASDSDIDSFLKAHAPDSSVFPGNDEIIQWVEIVSEGKLAAVAALCRWQSGRIVISSVATHSELRGKGIGKQLMEKCLITGHQLGEKFLCLGVRHENESAQRLYNGTGFRLMHNFTYCERR